MMPTKKPPPTAPKVPDQGLVILHMPNNPSCLCNKCNMDREVAECMRIANNHAEDFDFPPPAAAFQPTGAPFDPQAPQVTPGSPPAIPRAATAAAFAPTASPLPAASPPASHTFAWEAGRHSSPFPHGPDGIAAATTASATSSRGAPSALVTPIRANNSPTNNQPPLSKRIGRIFHVDTFGSARGSVEVTQLGQALVGATTHLIFKAAKSGESNPLVNQANASIAASIGDLEALGVATEEITTSTTQFFSRVVHHSLLTPLAQIGVHSLSTFADFAPRSNGDEDIRKVDMNHKGCFFFTPLMLKNKGLSLLNEQNHFEFTQLPNGNKVVNRDWWKENLQTKRKRDGGLFTTLEIGAFLPDWQVADCFKEEHEDAMKWMQENSAVFGGNNTLFLSLKNEYAHVFIKNMESPMVAKARLLGFHPLFLMKNAIVQSTEKFGINGHQFTTINLKPKSFLALVGFFKGKGEDLQLITLKNEDNSNFMVLSGPSHR